jgi:thiol-disulfide isomerase/thioredoxin
MHRIPFWSVPLLLAAALAFAPRAYGGGDKKVTKADDKPAAGGKDVRIEGELKADDPLDKVLAKSHAKVHPFKMMGGKVYKIEMTNDSKIDPFLRLEDAQGKELAMDDDGAGFPNARIIFKAPADGEYRIIATTFPPGKTGDATGKYVLTIGEINWKEYLAAQVKPFADKGADLTIKDAFSGAQMAMNLEGGSPDLAADAYEELGKVVAKASDAEVAKLGRMMGGAARRVKLIGNPITVRGETLEGKAFDWAQYKGKVVLVDFWATWCGPCREEIPNIKKMYEQYHKRGFDVVAISLDRGKDEPIKYMEKEKLPWVCLFDKDPGKDNEPLAEYYGVFAIPRAILVDRDGRVVSMNARGDELERLLEKHVGGKGEKSDTGAK